jgi:hypothetical protein
MGDFHGVDAYHALAWSYLHTGQPDEARQLLALVERWFIERAASAHTLRSTALYNAARNALLMSNEALGLDRLEQAVSAGWREYYITRHDSRWAALADDPRYQALMAEVKADVDRQRAEIERIDAEEGFSAPPDEVRPERD